MTPPCLVYPFLGYALLAPLLITLFSVFPNSKTDLSNRTCSRIFFSACASSSFCFRRCSANSRNSFSRCFSRASAIDLPELHLYSWLGYWKSLQNDLHSDAKSPWPALPPPFSLHLPFAFPPSVFDNLRFLCWFAIFPVNLLFQFLLFCHFGWGITTWWCTTRIWFLFFARQWRFNVQFSSFLCILFDIFFPQLIVK